MPLEKTRIFYDATFAVAKLSKNQSPELFRVSPLRVAHSGTTSLAEGHVIHAFASRQASELKKFKLNQNAFSLT